MRKFIKSELSHFYLLSSKTRLLLISFILQGAASALIGIFVNAYIWQSRGDLLSILLYNLGDIIALPIVFYINGILLKRIHVQILYFIGALCIGISSLLVVFYTWFNPAAYLVYGLLFGIGHGLYWANRNLLTLQETESKTRNYFIGINYACDFITSILVPFITGWFIALGAQMHLIVHKTSYGISMMVAFILLFLSGLLLLRQKYDKERITNVHLVNPTLRWWKVRLLMVGIGMAESASIFLPTVLVLIHLGNEGILGSLNAVVSILSAAAMYLFGRLAHVHHRKSLFLFSIIMGIAGSLILTLYQTNIGVVLYICINSFAVMAMWLAGEPMMLDIVDEERIRGSTEKYAFVFDRELFLNIGRILIFALCIGLLKFGGITYVFLLFPLISWISLLGIAVFIKIPLHP